MLTYNQPNKRVRKVENLNPERGISSSLDIQPDIKLYKTCLFLAEMKKAIVSTFPSEQAAYSQMRKYRQLYRQLNKNNNKPSPT